jgi:hypothetical protein
MIVRKSLNFERGQEPIKSMEISIVFPCKQIQFHNEGLGRVFGTLVLRYHNLTKLQNYYIKRWPVSRITVEKMDGDVCDLADIIDKGYKYLELMGHRLDISKKINESLNFERGQDPKEAIFGIRPGTLVTNDRVWNGTSIMIEVFLRTPTPEDFRKWDPKNEHLKDKYLTYEVGLLQDMPSTFFPHGFCGFNIVFKSENIRKLTDEENIIVLRGLADQRNLKTVQDIYDGVERMTGVKVKVPREKEKNNAL